MRPSPANRLALIGILVCLALGGLATTGSAALGTDAERADLDCSDFSSQAAAQNHLNGNPADPDALDSDGDGVACESNPCPCAGPGDDGGSGGGGGSTGGGSNKGARVVSVTDGDTIKVTLDGQEEDVRIIGIDTPEVFFGEECGGAEASASMKKLLEPGDRVKLFRDPSQDNRDAYDRLLRFVEQSGRDVGRKQLHRGWAQVYVFETPFDRVGSYRRQRNGARKADRGAWRLCDGNFHKPL